VWWSTNSPWSLSVCCYTAVRGTSGTVNLQATEQSTASYSNSVTTACRSYTIQLSDLTGLWLVLHLAAWMQPATAIRCWHCSCIVYYFSLYSKSCYLSSSYGYYHKYILSLISSRPINFKTMIPAMQTKTWLMTSKKEYVCHVTKISEQTMHYFYTFAQFEPWCWSDMAFPVFFKWHIGHIISLKIITAQELCLHLLTLCRAVSKCSKVLVFYL